MWENLGAIVALAALIFNAGTAALALIVRNSLLQVKVDLQKTMADASRDTDDRIDKQGREFGEIVTALRQKITEVEMWTRDTMVRRESFYKITDSLTENIKALGDKIEARFSLDQEVKTLLKRIEDKLSDESR